MLFRGDIPDAEVFVGEPTALNEDLVALICIEGSKLFTEADNIGVPEGLVLVTFAKAVVLPSLIEAMLSSVAFHQRIPRQ